MVYNEKGCHDLLCEVLRQVYRDINHDYEYAQPSKNAQPSKKYDAVMARHSAKLFLHSPEFDALCSIVGIRCISKMKRKFLA